jgi:delta-aminolevulinic acid dehydratase/porphobilinogen synthase
MLPAVPSGENFTSSNSKVVKKTGKAKTAYQERALITVLLVSIIIKAKMRGRTSVKIMAGTTDATVTKYQNQLSLPIKYAIKEIIKVIFPVPENEKIRTGMGASQSRYQKSPLNPLEKYQHSPETTIIVIIKNL